MNYDVEPLILYAVQTQMCALGYPVNYMFPIFLKCSDAGPMEDIPTASTPVISHLSSTVLLGWTAM